jgi:ATP-dependent Clp protease ATP-binding subunit ClpX
MLRNTGARGLRAIMEEVLLSVMYEIPSDPNAERVRITRETVLEKVYPTIIPRRDISGRRARHHRDSA